MKKRQTIEDKRNKKTGAGKRAQVDGGATGNRVAASELPVRLSTAGASLNVQAAGLDDGRLQGVQREALAAQIGEMQGNRHLQSVVSAVETNSERANVFRQPVASPKTGPITFRIGWLVDEVRIENYHQLFMASRFAVFQLRNDIEGLEAGSLDLDRARKWIEEVEAWQPFIEAQGEQSLSEASNVMAHKYLDEWFAIEHGIDEAKQARMRRELWNAQAKANSAAEQVEQLKPKLANGLRAAYRTGDESKIKEAADVVGTALDIGMGVRELSRMIAEKVAEHLETELAEAGKLTEGLEKFNRALAVLNLALIITDHERKATELEQGMKEIADASSAFAALATLGKLAPHIGLYANLYLVPMVKAIMAGVSRLVNQLHEANIEWVEFSGDIMYPAAEPGGQEMFDYMVSAMHAASADAMPPITKPIQEYLFDHREALEAGARTSTEREEEGEVPTKGWWFWRRLDTPKALEWLFEHRERVWAMFYGAMRVPEPRRRSAP